MDVDQDVVNFLEHHEDVLIEASEEIIAGEDSQLLDMTKGSVASKDEDVDETEKEVRREEEVKKDIT